MSNRAVRQLWQTLASCAGIFVAAGCATSWPVDPGDRVELDSDTGLLVVHVRTNEPLNTVEIGPVRAAEDLPPGTHVRLIGVSAGRYRWSEVRLRDRRFTFRSLDSLRFRVEPGVINYVGMIDVHRAGPFELYMRPIDRSAMALAELRKTHPALAARYPIVYSGGARHEFLPRYLQAERENARTRPTRNGVPQTRCPSGPCRWRSCSDLLRCGAWR